MDFDEKKNVELTVAEINYLRIAISQWHCFVSTQAFKTDDPRLHEAASDCYKLMQKLEALK